MATARFRTRSRLGAECGPGAEGGEEHGPLGGIVSELMTEDAKGPGCEAEAMRDLVGGCLLDEVSAEGLVLALLGRFGGQEEPSLWVVR